MKRTLSISFVIALVVIACSRNTIATKEPVIPKRETSTTSTPDSATIVSFALPELTDATSIALGKTIYETRCVRCHSLKNTGDYTAERWNGILRLMAPKARLTQTEIQQVTAFVKANAKK